MIAANLDNLQVWVATTPVDMRKSVVGTLYDANWTIRDTGVRWQSLMSEFDTDLMTTVNAEGALDL